MLGKKYRRIVISLAIATVLISGCEGRNQAVPGLQEENAEIKGAADKEDKNIDNEISEGIAEQADLPFPIGQPMNSPGDFNGTAYISSMITYDDTYHFPQTNHITFEPGARSGWHTHGGMIILVTGGVGYYQEEGKPTQIIRKGDVLECPEGIRHWHGAAKDSWFQHIAQEVSGEETHTEWCEPVNDEEYYKLP